MLIGIGYFTKGDRQIQNATTSQTMGQNSLAVKSAVEGFIEQYQPIYLRKVLGDTLAEAIEEDETSATYTDLIDQIKEPLAEFVFFHIIGSTNDTATINGMIRLKNAENNSISALRPMVSAWNRMVELHKAFVKWAETSAFDVIIQKEMLTHLNTLNV